MTRIRVFASFDHRNDCDLHDLLIAQSKRPGSAFEVLEHETHRAAGPESGIESRSTIRSADEVVVICGEHTHESLPVAVELSIAQEENKPYMLLWGRRDKMCMKPDGARTIDAMYSWTREILESQIAATIRSAKPLEVPENCKRLQR